MAVDRKVVLRLSAEGADQVVGALKSVTGQSAELDAAYQTLVRSSPQLASAADQAAAALTRVGEQIKKAETETKSENLAKFGEVLAKNTGIVGQFAAAFATGGAIGLGISVFEKMAEGAKELITAIPEAGDAFTRINAQLTAVAGSAELGARAYELLAESAAKTGISVEQSSAAFLKLSTAGQEVGLTTRQVADLTRGIQEIGLMSGATAGQIESVFNVITRSLLSGQLDQRGLRGLFTELPAGARALADAIGVSASHLKEMAAAGQLTNDVLAPALERMGDKADEAFAKMPETITRSTGQLHAAMDEFLIQLDHGLNFAQRIAAAMQGWTTIIHSITPASGIEQMTKVIEEQEAILARMENEGVKADPYSGQDIPASHQDIEQAKAAIELTREARALAIKHADDAEAQEEETSAAKALDAKKSRSAQATTALMLELDKRLAIQKKYGDEVKKLNEGRDLGVLSPEDYSKGSALAAKARDDALAALAKKPDSFSFADVERQIDGWRDKAKEAAQSTVDSLDPASAAAHKYTKELEDLAKAQTALGFSSERMDLLTDAAAKRYTDSLDQIAKKGDTVGASFDKFFDKTASGFEDAIAKGEGFSKILQSLETDIARLITRATITGPLTAALDKAGGASGLFGSLYNNTLGRAFGTSDAFGNAFTSTSADVATKAATAAFNFADGGIMGPQGRVPVRNYAGGGIANSPQWAQYGEGSTPEAYVPLPDGNSIPVRMQGGSGTALHSEIHIHMQGSSTGPQQLAQVVRYAVDQSHAELLAGVRRGGRLAQEFGRKR